MGRSCIAGIALLAVLITLVAGQTPAADSFRRTASGPPEPESFSSTGKA